MKRLILLICIISMLCYSSIVCADAVGPEFPSSYSYHTKDISPFIFVAIAIAIVAVSCIVSAQTNKKMNSKRNETIQQKEDK